MDFTTYEPRISALESGGGGGETSELSKAKVTLTTDKQMLQAQSLFLPVCVDYVDAQHPERNYSALIYQSVYFDGGTTDIALYKGEFRELNSGFNSESTEFEVTGNAVIRWSPVAETWVFKITGDCTINLITL